MIVAIVDIEVCLSAGFAPQLAVQRAESLGVAAVIVRDRLGRVASGEVAVISGTIAAIPALYNGPPDRPGVVSRGSGATDATCPGVVRSSPGVVHGRFAGVHLRADAATPTGVVGWVGRSVHVGEPMRDATADYLLFAPVFAPRSKPGVAGVGLSALASAVASSLLPVVGLGGIDAANVARVAEVGAAAAAALTPFCDPDDAAAIALVAASRNVHWAPRRSLPWLPGRR